MTAFQFYVHLVVSRERSAHRRSPKPQLFCAATAGINLWSVGGLFFIRNILRIQLQQVVDVRCATADSHLAVSCELTIVLVSPLRSESGTCCKIPSPPCLFWGPDLGYPWIRRRGRVHSICSHSCVHDLDCLRQCISLRAGSRAHASPDACWRSGSVPRASANRLPFQACW